MPQVAFCSIALRQLHEILNSEINDKKSVLNKDALMDQFIEINSRLAINWCKTIVDATDFLKIQQ